MTLTRSRTQLRRTRLKNKGKRRRSAREKRLMAEFASYTGRYCDICDTAYRVQGHHILEQQHVEEAARALGLDWEALLWDPRNHMSVCDPCHDAHHEKAKPIRLKLVMRVAPGVWDFANELGLTWRLRAYYA